MIVSARGMLFLAGLVSGVSPAAAQDKSRDRPVEPPLRVDCPRDAQVCPRIVIEGDHASDTRTFSGFADPGQASRPRATAIPSSG